MGNGALGGPITAWSRQGNQEGEQWEQKRRVRKCQVMKIKQFPDELWCPLFKGRQSIGWGCIWPHKGWNTLTEDSGARVLSSIRSSNKEHEHDWL